MSKEERHEDEGLSAVSCGAYAVAELVLVHRVVREGVCQVPSQELRSQP